MKPVIQKERTGCGIASVAALAGISYDRAKAEANRLGIFAEDGKLWSDTKYVRTLLREFGISVAGKQRRFVTWEKVPDRALLAVKWHLEKGTPFWHWVVFAREGKCLYVLDSRKGLKENKRTDLGRMKPKWYIRVNS